MNKPFCPLPWVMLATRNDGKVRLCAHAHSSPGKGANFDSQGEILSIGSSSLECLQNSEFMKSVRNDFLNGKFPESCTRCAKEVSLGIRSRPDYESENWSHVINLERARSQTQEDGSIQTPIRFLDLRLGNLCNLKCRTCNPTESSSWYSDHVSVWGKTFRGFQGQKLELEQVGKHYNVVGDSFEWGEMDVLAPALVEALESVELIHFSGGEPLLLKAHLKVLEHLVQNGRAQEVRLEYITNLTVLPPKVLELWKSFADVRIGVSLDGVGVINDYIRAPSRWNDIETNLDKLDQWQKPESIWYALTLHAYNIYYLPEIIQWRINNPFLNINNRKPDPLFSAHPLHNPAFLNMQMLPKAVKQGVRNKLLYYLESGKRDNRFENSAFVHINNQVVEDLIVSYLQFMDGQDLSHLFPKFIQYTEKLDSVRNQSLEKSLPDFFNLINDQVPQVAPGAEL